MGNFFLITTSEIFTIIKDDKTGDFDFEHVDGSGVPGTISRNSLVSENCPGQDLLEPEDG